MAPCPCRGAWAPVRPPCRAGSKCRSAAPWFPGSARPEPPRCPVRWTWWRPLDWWCPWSSYNKGPGDENGCEPHWEQETCGCAKMLFVSPHNNVTLRKTRSSSLLPWLSRLTVYHHTEYSILCLPQMLQEWKNEPTFGEDAHVRNVASTRTHQKRGFW